jgi:hypothetical protein
VFDRGSMGGVEEGEVNDVFSFPKSKRAKIQYVVGNMLPASQDVGEPVTDHYCYRN